ncbi:MAG: hypothetical protein CM1200mP29_10080 [Verrucomicrobiota bacterium]|nr:MAG: hypothetical protein CM1200mP29_10080 [Verrucomicrobiota bacterium]
MVGRKWLHRLGGLALLPAGVPVYHFPNSRAAVTALLFCWWFGPKIISLLKRLKFGQNYKDKAEEAGGLDARVLSKKGTPSMGGVMIVLALDVTVLLWAKWNEFLALSLMSVVVWRGWAFMTIGSSSPSRTRPASSRK